VTLFWSAGALLAVLLPLPASAEIEVATSTYRCERGVAIPVTYVNADGGSAVVLNVEGRQITLIQAEAASGARYAWPSDGSGYVWWNKGDTATLSWFDAAKSEEVMLFADCKVE
jgi:membrane-bound inhibitor of C-type lysozyme